MMMNLFEIFDPMNSNSLSLNWLSTMFIFLMMPYLFWMSSSRPMIMFNTMINFIFKEFKMLSSNKYKINIIMFFNLLIMIIMFNFMGLLPFIFTPSSHMSMNLSLALPMWLSFMMFSVINKPLLTIAHFVPLNTPSSLMNFMSLIELISNIIRPWTLSIRLTANMIAGHLLLTLLGNFISIYSSIMTFLIIMIIIQNLLFILEMSVALIQSYVFSILSLLYFIEAK